jgi:hypothetical protein
MKPAPMSQSKKTVQDRIKDLEDAIAKGREYLESGRHADWSGFRPYFAPKLKGGKALPPHKKWVKNVFLPRTQRALAEAEKILEKFELSRD